MFTTDELKSIDRTYFHIINAACYCVTLQSKNTNHYWHIIHHSTVSPLALWYAASFIRHKLGHRCPSTSISPSFKSHFTRLYTFFRICVHYRVSLCICRIFVHEGNHHVVKQDQTAARLRIGDVHKLFFRQSQFLRQNTLVFCILIQQIDKIRVAKNTLDLLRS